MSLKLEEFPYLEEIINSHYAMISTSVMLCVVNKTQKCLARRQTGRGSGIDLVSSTAYTDTIDNSWVWLKTINV